MTDNKKKLCTVVLLLSLAILFFSCVTSKTYEITDKEIAYSTFLGQISYSSTFLPSVNSMVDISLAEYDNQGTYIREIFNQKIRNPKKFPLNFSVKYESDEIKKEMVYNIIVKFYDNDKVFQVSKEITFPVSENIVIPLK